MATTLTTLETVTRRHLKESSASFWSSAELVQHFNDGIQNLWGAIIDLYEEHYITIDVTNVSLAADATSLTGVPSDTFRVFLIEPRDTTSAGTAPNTMFRPKRYNSPEFANARAMTSQEIGSGLVVYYAVQGAGYPVGTPTITTGPKISTALNLRFVYVPGIAAKVAANDNPIPGQSDQALIAYCTAWALAKDREDKMPDTGWLSIFKTEKDAILGRLKPRQEQEEWVVDDLFSGWVENDEFA